MSSILGRRVKYTVGEGADATEVIGTCIGERHTGTIILDTDTGQEWPGVRFTLRTDDGRKVETITYPNMRP
jgi:hypothetical protein